MPEFEIMDGDTGLASYTRDCGHIELLNPIIHEEFDGTHLVTYDFPETDHPCAVCWAAEYPTRLVAGVAHYTAICMCCGVVTHDTLELPSHEHRCEECKRHG